ncbi:hypothetical protein [Deinococcus soli (ex Cha et al. 2016)]|uniref:Uncharacterized protein n=2 Tax=Deinococcus soli (ex Cha et al. 2016) TaxID=1309411 RepID=A0ACC6KG75_9DEIO|nr:hypothetical protein [Deinococcus soli (ex Cha et al. 2016)]MDR6218539.1 hypothetical protein [Deinococcus soli (ex Cha et al. 2016)]MDR6329279.1 hypothetical protein [Deinococcus soli (ex Cha et al. 2016)]MDR6751552.1 hypothetical protein [Deinococcus soli (ex Cha et al. 2016)]
MKRLRDPHRPALTFLPEITPRKRQRLYRALEDVARGRQAQVDWVVALLGGDRVLGGAEMGQVYRALRVHVPPARPESEGERLSYRLAGF